VAVESAARSAAEVVLWHDGPQPLLRLVPADAVGVERWLRGVALGALGRYLDAAATLRPLLAVPETASLAASTLASHARQVGRHRRALAWDERARAAAECAADPHTAYADVTSGLVADAIGLGDLAAATAAMADAQVAAADSGGWRARTRVSWVAAELALLAADPGAAVTAACVACESSAGAPRHEAKSLLVRGVARCAAGARGGTDDLREAADRSAELGVVTLEWPASVVLAEELPAESPFWRARAGRSLARVAQGLGPVAGARFSIRPDISAFLLPGQR
jgi:hypothetical protein